MKRFDQFSTLKNDFENRNFEIFDKVAHIFSKSEDNMIEYVLFSTDVCVVSWTITNSSDASTNLVHHFFFMTLSQFEQLKTNTNFLLVQNRFCLGCSLPVEKYIVHNNKY
jgi:hypothetical protein